MIKEIIYNSNTIRTVTNSLKLNYCPACGSAMINKLGDINYGEQVKYSSFDIMLSENPELWQCGHCDSWFTQNIITEEDSICLYSSGDSAKRWESEKTIEKRRSADILDIMSTYFKPSLKVLDIGCNDGDLLDFAQKRGCYTAGLEYSQNARIILKSKNHHAFSSFEEVDDTFDIITAFDLVEHLYDFEKFIYKCRSLLNPGGVLIFLTVDNTSSEAIKFKSKWWYVSFPEHILFPSLNAFEFCDLQIVKYKKIRLFMTEDRLTIRSVIRRCIRLFSNKYVGWPFYPNHHLLVLNPRSEK